MTAGEGKVNNYDMTDSTSLLELHELYTILTDSDLKEVTPQSCHQLGAIERANFFQC